MIASLPSALLIVGAGASGREIAWIAREALGPNISIRFAVESPFFGDGSAVDGIPVHRLEELTPVFGERYVIAIGSGTERERLDRVCGALGLEAQTLIHPQAIISPRVHLEPGAVIYPGTVITTNVIIGRHAHVNCGCTISHDVVLGDFATLSPTVSIAGHVRIGRAAFLGIGAIIVNGKLDKPLEIGDRAKVFAGSCVTKPVCSDTCVAGVPAKVRYSN